MTDSLDTGVSAYHCIQIQGSSQLSPKEVINVFRSSVTYVDGQEPSHVNLSLKLMRVCHSFSREMVSPLIWLWMVQKNKLLVDLGESVGKVGVTLSKCNPIPHGATQQRVLLRYSN